MGSNDEMAPAAAAAGFVNKNMHEYNNSDEQEVLGIDHPIRIAGS